jgi:CRP-like cAMP-binding protein
VRHVPASVTELSRIGLLAELPGEQLTKLAHRMRREEVGPGQPLLREGDEGDRFYVVLNGLLSVTQNDRGLRRMTLSTVASCDRETFDEFIRPLFAE